MFKVFRPIKLFVNNLNYVNGFGVIIRFVLSNIVDTGDKLFPAGSDIAAANFSPMSLPLASVLWED
jgi:hypothetical protein